MNFYRILKTDGTLIFGYTPETSHSPAEQVQQGYKALLLGISPAAGDTDREDLIEPEPRVIGWGVIDTILPATEKEALDWSMSNRKWKPQRPLDLSDMLLSDLCYVIELEIVNPIDGSPNRSATRVEFLRYYNQATAELAAKIVGALVQSGLSMHDAIGGGYVKEFTDTEKGRELLALLERRFFPQTRIRSMRRVREVNLEERT